MVKGKIKGQLMRLSKFATFFLLMLLLSQVNTAQSENSPKLPEPAQTPSAERQNILFLNTYQSGLPIPDSIERGLLTALHEGGGSVNDIFIEHLDLAREPSKEYRIIMAELLRRKLSGKQIGIIIVEGTPALDFLTTEAKGLFPDAAILSLITPGIDSLRDGPYKIMDIPWRVDPAGTLRVALDLFPKTRRVFVVTGARDDVLPFLEEAKNAFTPWKTLDFEFTNEMSYEQMLNRISSLPSDSIIIYSPFFSDTSGRSFVPAEVVVKVSQLATVPVFATLEAYLGRGIVGGALLKTESIGHQAGKIALDYLSGHLELIQPITTFNTSTPNMLDWHQLERWKANTSALPKDSIIINRPLTLMGQYKGEVITAAIAFLCLSAMVLALLMLNRHLKRLTVAARDSEARFRVMMEYSPEAIVVYDPDLKRIIDVNPTAEQFFGCTLQMLLKQDLQRFYQSGQVDEMSIAESMAEYDRRALAGEEVLFEQTVYTDDKRKLQCEIRLVQLPYKGQRLLRASLIDITDRKKAEESLHAIEWLLNKPLEKLSNPAQYYGNLKALNTNRLIFDSIGDDVLSDIVTGYLELLETSAAVYERNGDYAHGIFSSGWCRMLDSASRSLCETESNIEALASGRWLCHESCWMDASKVSIETGEPMDIDCHGGMKIYAVPIKANDTVIGSINFGYGDPPKSMSQIEQIAKKYKVDPAELLKQANRYKKRPAFIIEIAKKRVQSSARLIGALVESKMAQSELKREKEKLNVTLHSIGDGVITTDNIGNVVLVNTVAETLTGWTQEEARGKPLDVVFHIINEHTRQRCDNPVEKVLETNGIVGLANHTVLVSRDGIERIIADSGAPIIDHDQNTIGVVLVFRDITEQSKMEIELQHAHKLEAIGTLAGGIAHDFNNILAAVLGYADMAMDDIPKHSPARYQIDQVLKAGNRAKDLVKHILSFSRKESQVRVPLEVSKILQEALKFLRATIPTTIEIKESHDIENGIILADATQLHQVIVNLCTNAAHAMEEQGGILGITLSSQDFSENELKKEPSLKPGPYVRLCVSDTGTGIDQRYLDKIFDPYFTTKEVGKGSGMGLAVVVGIVKSHDGMITVDSKLGEGTTFNVYFPRIEEQIHEEVEVTATLPGGNEKILVVDDEESIVYMTKRRLELLGYQVTTKTSSIDALELFRSQPDQFDLVITDQTMPGLTGEQLAKELLSIRPGFPIILCTGYSSKIDAEKADFVGIRDFIMKPVERSELANTVRRILDRK